MSSIEKTFEAYKDSVIKACAADSQSRRVAASAAQNAVDTLGRNIKHLADDSMLLAMRGDKEWLDLWAASVAGLLCSGEYPQAESFFAQYEIQA